MVNLIAGTRTSQGLSIQAQLDDRPYETGKRVSDQQMQALAITRCDSHGEWNYKTNPL